ncbi:hypothetical protein N7G274_008143 [Stereocaulon virgatum]|uniref:Uncharacterized protein n=1 Tax=Stereocaulon virgatum TaxID=373712 RepID=A0ABR4A2W0_9LECA
MATLSCPNMHTEIEGLTGGLESGPWRVYGLFNFLPDMMGSWYICLTGCHHIDFGVLYIIFIDIHERNFIVSSSKSSHLTVAKRPIRFDIAFTPRPEFYAEHRPPTVHG